ncbi:MAG: DUF1456 family protein [Flavobacterium sp.]
MTNNDIFKKLRVALQLRDDQIVEILQLVDFRMTKGELSAFFRNEDHPNYMECGDQVLRNFLNGLVIHLRGTKEQPKNPREVLKTQSVKPKTPSSNSRTSSSSGSKPYNKKPSPKSETEKPKKDFKIPVVEHVRFKNGKK